MPCDCGRPDCPEPLQLQASELFKLRNDQIDAAHLSVSRGDQRTAEWHQAGAGRIGGSIPKKVASASCHDVKLNKAKQRCYVAGPSGSSEKIRAKKWGNEHEPTAVWQYHRQLAAGTKIAVYKGPVDPSNSKFWRDKQWQQHLTPEDVHYPGVWIDDRAFLQPFGTAGCESVRL